MNTESCDLDERQMSVRDAIATHWRNHEYGPSVRELSEALHMPLSMVQQRIDELVDMGAVTRTPKISRTLRVVQ